MPAFAFGRTINEGHNSYGLGSFSLGMQYSRHKIDSTGCYMYEGAFQSLEFAKVMDARKKVAQCVLKKIGNRIMLRNFGYLYHHKCQP